MTFRQTAYLSISFVVIMAGFVLVPVPLYSHKPITTNILFKNEVAQIFQRKCLQCHTENNLAMPLLTYTDARPWARAIREEILDREMPPWTAVPGYGHFVNDISLTTRETEIILSWTDGGAPSGVLKAEEPIPPVYVPPVPEWALGEPDAVLPIGSGHIVEAGAAFTVQRFTVATDWPGAKRVRAIALKQGDRRVVRHAAFYEGRTKRWLAAWTPWQTVTRLPDGVAFELGARSQIVVEIGYAGTEQNVTDKSELGLYFSTGSGPAVDAVRLAGAEATLAAGVTAHRVRTETKIAAPVSLLALWPTPSDSARSIEITATTADGITTPLLWIKNYRPAWRSPYLLSAPVPLAKGTRLAMTTYFDNPSDRADVARADAWLTVVPGARANEGRRTKNRS